MMTYHIRRTDSNQCAIVKALRKAGFSVAITSSLGQGFPDLVIALPRPNLEPYTALAEIKDGSKPLSAQKLTPDEIKFRDNWSGNYHIIRSEEEVGLLLDSLMKAE